MTLEKSCFIKIYILVVLSIKKNETMTKQHLQNIYFFSIHRKHDTNIYAIIIGLSFFLDEIENNR
jgi:hypothetical protein